MARSRTDYDTIADGYDERYALHRYDGIRETVEAFLGGAARPAVLDAGCGTGHWLQAMRGRARLVTGMDVSAAMLARAHAAAPGVPLVRARAEQSPWRDASFDRVVCINALHHFSDRRTFFVEARRVLTRGGALLTIGLDPHTERDTWWVYDFFPETRALDRERFARVRIIRGELTTAGFDWAESFEAEHLETQMTMREAFPQGLARSYTSQFSLLTDEQFAAGVERLRAAGDDAPLVVDLRLYGTIGRVAAE